MGSGEAAAGRRARRSRGARGAARRQGRGETWLAGDPVGRQCRSRRLCRRAGGDRVMKDTRFGAVIANVLSVATRGLGLFLWYFLRLIYRGEPKVVAGFVT